MIGKLKLKVSQKESSIAVVGLGYVGLPLAMRFTKKGFKVFGIDKDSSRCKRLNSKKSFLSHISDQNIKDAVNKMP